MENQARRKQIDSPPFDGIFDNKPLDMYQLRLPDAVCAVICLILGCHVPGEIQAE
jgi:hypothetical protein